MKQLPDTAKAEIEAGVRWASNILVELQGNYSARQVDHPKFAQLREATRALAEFQRIPWGQK